MIPGTNAELRPKPASGLSAFCHAIPQPASTTPSRTESRAVPRNPAIAVTRRWRARSLIWTVGAARGRSALSSSEAFAFAAKRNRIRCGAT